MNRALYILVLSPMLISYLHGAESKEAEDTRKGSVVLTLENNTDPFHKSAATTEISNWATGCINHRVYAVESFPTSEIGKVNIGKLDIIDRVTALNLSKIHLVSDRSVYCGWFGSRENIFAQLLKPMTDDEEPFNLLLKTINELTVERPQLFYEDRATLFYATAIVSLQDNEPSRLNDMTGFSSRVQTKWLRYLKKTIRLENSNLGLPRAEERLVEEGVVTTSPVHIPRDIILDNGMFANAITGLNLLNEDDKVTESVMFEDS